MSWPDVTNFAIAMLAVVNPLGKVPLWCESTSSEESAVRVRLAGFFTFTAFVILCGALVGGVPLLGLFGIDLASFRIGGGIVILLMGIQMLHGRAVDAEAEQSSEESDAYERAKARFRDLLVPLCIPILAGPGSITTAMLYGAKADGWLEIAVMAAVIGGLMAVVFAVLLVGPRIQDVVGDLTLRVQTRIFGLLRAAIAVQLIVEGLGAVFPEWVSTGSEIYDDLQATRDAAP